MTRNEGDAVGSEQPSAIELVFAVCHELGNWLAGTRLEANLIDSLSERAEFAKASRRIESASARAGSLLALIRPLLDPESTEIIAVDPLDVLAGLRSGLDESVDSRVTIELKSAVDLAPICLPAEPLHHLLGSAIYYALEAGGDTGGVRVRASAENGIVEFAVLDGKSFSAAGGAPSLRGRSLLLAVAQHVIGPLRGRAAESAHADGSSWTLAFPKGAP